ncbi:treslin isoform X3, partial [Biomphalaria pfeifferi]
LILFVRGLMFVTDPIHLNDFLLEVVISYAVAVPKLLTDVYDELMLPLPPALSKFASPVSSKAPMSVLNKDSFMSAPSSTQPTSHLSDQASQPA